MKFCSKCGAEMSDDTLFCQTCGTAAGAGQEVVPVVSGLAEASQGTTEYPMKWFKFLIYFALFAGAVLNLVNGINYITGGVWVAATDGLLSAEIVYAMFEGLQVLDMVYGILLVAFAGWQIYTRFCLAGFKKNGPLCLYVLYGVGPVLSLFYVIMASVILGESAIDAGTGASIFASLGMLGINVAYFGKRKELFKN